MNIYKVDDNKWVNLAHVESWSRKIVDGRYEYTFDLSSGKTFVAKYNGEKIVEYIIAQEYENAMSKQRFAV